MKPTATLTPDGQAGTEPCALTGVSSLPAPDTTPTGQARAAKTMADMLAAAAAGGYQQADILETLLTMGEVSKRVTAMCADAMDAAGNERIRAIFEAMRLTTKGGAQ